MKFLYIMIATTTLLCSCSTSRKATTELNGDLGTRHVPRRIKNVKRNFYNEKT